MASSISKNHDDGSLPLRPTELPPTKPLDWARAAGKTDVVLRGIEEELRHIRRKRRRIGAAVLVFLFAAAGLWQLRPNSERRATPSASAIVSIPQRQVLPDGTVVELKDGAKITAQFSPAFRRVELQAGEAHFQVVSDAARPFVVRAGGVDVRAVGTAFSVQWSAAQVEVLVTEGRVAVDQLPTEGARSIAVPVGIGRTPQTIATLDAGSLVVVTLASDSSATAAVTPVSPAEQNERLGWRVPRLELLGTPLDAVLPLVNKYGKVRLVLGDPELGKLEISGLLRADKVEVLLRLLETSYGLKVERRDDQIVLRR